MLVRKQTPRAPSGSQKRGGGVVFRIPSPPPGGPRWTLKGLSPCSWDTREEDVRALAADLRAVFPSQALPCRLELLQVHPISIFSTHICFDHNCYLRKYYILSDCFIYSFSYLYLYFIFLGSRISDWSSDPFHMPSSLFSHASAWQCTLTHSPNHSPLPRPQIDCTKAALFFSTLLLFPPPV